MSKVQFLGKILPPVIGFDITSPDLKYTWEAANKEPVFRVRIGSCIVNIEIEIENYDRESHFLELYMRSIDYAKTAVNIIAFCTGIGITVIMDTFIGEDGMPSTIVPQAPSFAQICTAYKIDRGDDIDEIFRLIVTSPPLFRALNDLIEAITIPHVSCVNCGRVIDSIRRMITPTGTSSDKQAWTIMHTVLNISPDYQRWISEQAKGPRHGDPSFVPGNITSEVTLRTWSVMNRFLEYKKRGNHPLTGSEFPLLS